MDKTNGSTVLEWVEAVGFRVQEVAKWAKCMWGCAVERGLRVAWLRELFRVWRVEKGTQPQGDCRVGAF